MTGSPKLAAVFLSHLRVRFEASADVAVLERLLVRAWEDARAQWPTVELPAELFVKHLAERLPADTPPDNPLGKLFVAELFLACACLHNLPPALHLFEQHYLAKLTGARQQSAATLDEVRQLARVRILVHTPERPPKIAEYMGKGSLLNWVRTLAVRITSRLRETDRSSLQEDDELLMMLPALGAGPEVGYIRARHHEDLRQAIHQAFASLSDEERYLLRLYFVDGLSTHELAPLLRVSQPTISRRLKEAREAVDRETRRHLQARLGLAHPADLQSFLHLLDSQFKLSLSRLLGPEGAPPRKPEDG